MYILPSSPNRIPRFRCPPFSVIIVWRIVSAKGSSEAMVSSSDSRYGTLDAPCDALEIVFVDCSSDALGIVFMGCSSDALGIVFVDCSSDALGIVFMGCSSSALEIVFVGYSSGVLGIGCSASDAFVSTINCHRY